MSSTKPTPHAEIFDQMASMLADENIPVEGVLLSLVLRAVDAKYPPQDTLAAVREVLEIIKELVDHLIVVSDRDPLGETALLPDGVTRFLHPLPEQMYRWRDIAVVLPPILDWCSPKRLEIYRR